LPYSCVYGILLVRRRHVFLSILATVLSGLAYVSYLLQVYSGTSVPNPASWTVWAFLATLNAFSYWKASGDALASSQFFLGSGLCISVFGYSLVGGKFSKLGESEIVVLVFCLVITIVWLATESASYANFLVAVVTLYSAYPTIVGVKNSPSIEAPLPWIIWTIAFTVTTINVARRYNGRRISFLMPIVCVLIHGAVAGLAL
jgi:hypothetical protein